MNHFETCGVNLSAAQQLEGLTQHVANPQKLFVKYQQSLWLTNRPVAPWVWTLTARVLIGYLLEYVFLISTPNASPNVASTS